MNRRQFIQVVSSSALAARTLPRGLLAAREMAPADFAIRGFEFCGTGMWQWKSIDRALALMEQLGFNTLIIHQNDLPDYIVWPAAYFSADFMYARNPVRTDLTCNGRNYVREVGRRAAARNIRLLVEDKEIWYPDGLIELHPELMEVKGIVCPTHPFWWEYLRVKYAELLEQVPEISGVMVSPGSRESKVTFAARNCPCDRCKSYQPADWYKNLVQAIHQPIQAQRKMLAVRDHTYRKEEQDALVDACAQVSPQVIVSLSNTPHDFYPTFPNNPRIGRTGTNPQWVEFDAMGQFSGMGVFPCSFVEDFQRRLAHAGGKGVSGVWFRADVEFVSDCSVFNSPNLLNVIGAARLAHDSGGDLTAIYQAWLGFGLANPLKTESEQTAPVSLQEADRARMQEFMKKSWPILEKTVYVRGLVFTDGTGQFPDSVDQAFDNLLGLHRRDEWDPGAAQRVEPTEENIRLILAEKAAAERELADLRRRVNPAEMQLPPELRNSWTTLLDLYGRYVTGFKHCAACCFLARKAAVGGQGDDRAAARAAADRLAAFRDETAAWLESVEVPHYVRRMFELRHLDRLVADVRAKTVTQAA